ncbi:MAG TPA: hypothetical protein VHC67_03730 [Gaiellaceae bacterium]|nr:hypothetical protein [Gaiellaceae bacterium]
MFDRVRHRPPDEAPELSLVQRGGGGGTRRWDVRFWVWPLPPEGPFTFVVEWPSQGVELTRHEIDAAPILEAAGRAYELWPGDPPPGGGWVAYA